MCFVCHFFWGRLLLSVELAIFWKLSIFICRVTSIVYGFLELAAGLNRERKIREISIKPISIIWTRIIHIGKRCFFATFHFKPNIATSIILHLSCNHIPMAEKTTWLMKATVNRLKSGFSVRCSRKVIWESVLEQISNIWEMIVLKLQCTLRGDSEMSEIPRKTQKFKAYIVKWGINVGVWAS